jgi:hypothetical protein
VSKVCSSLISLFLYGQYETGNGGEGLEFVDWLLARFVFLLTEILHSLYKKRKESSMLYDALLLPHDDFRCKSPNDAELP